MSSPSRKPRVVRVKGASALRAKNTLKFAFRTAGFPREGFVVKVRGKFWAYLNRCPHAGSALDFGDNDFFTDDGRWLMCRAHGAVFEPAGGLCVAGPCAGESLVRLPVKPGKGRSLEVAWTDDTGPGKLI